MPRSLLLADDSVTIQKAVGMTFKGEDVTLTMVSDGEEALARAKEMRPDLILADVGMPGMGGYELCEKVRADAGIRHIPVLLLGGGTPVDPSKAIAVGANGHMPKPFDSQKLIDQVKQILANPKMVPSAVATPAAPPPVSKPPVSRPPAQGAPRPAQPAGTTGSTLTMARPPTVPGMRPPAPGAPRSTAPPPARPGAPGAAPRPPGSVPPGVRPPVPPGARPAAPAGMKPPGVPASRPPGPPPAGARPPGMPSKPPVPQAKPPAPPRAEQTDRLTAPIGLEDDEIPMEVDDIVEEASAPVPAPLRAVPPPAGRQPSLSVVPPERRGAAGASDGGEALLREALSKASREVIEKIAWEVVPELAETIIREELERLMKERGA